MIYEGQILDQTYQIIKQIGHGGTGVVYFAYHLHLEKYIVVKQITGTSDMSLLRKEVDILKNLHHTNLPQVYDFIWTGSEVYTVMDYVEGQDLAHLLESGRRFTQEELLKWLNQLTDVLIYLHGQDPPVIHSDIKPGNIIITPENNAVLIDFNVSLSGDSNTVIGLSMNYASPEQVAMMQQSLWGVPTSERLDGRSDIYSLCATFYTLICYKLPNAMYAETPLSDQETDYNPVLSSIIDQGMAPERELRYQTAEELKKALDGIWRKSAGFRLYLISQAIVILLAGLLIAVGVNRMIRGVQENERNAFISEYNRVIQVINHGDAAEAVSVAYDFRNAYKDQLEDEPTLYGELLYGQAGRQLEQGDFEDSAETYLLAAECYEPEDPAMVECYAGAAIARVRSGDIDGGQEILDEAGREGVEGDLLSLLELQVMSLEGRREECLLAAKHLNETAGDRDVIARADIAASKVCAPEEKIGWLQMAWDSGTYDAECIRQIGYEALSLGSEELAGGQSTMTDEAVKLAGECYTEICRKDDAVLSDFLNCCTALRLQKCWNDALAALDSAEENSEIPAEESMLLYMHRAYVYDEKGDSVRARSALREAAPLLEGNMIRQEEKEKLADLLKKYDV